LAKTEKTKPEMTATQSAIAAINKTHGTDSVIRLGDKPRVSIPCISTGSLSLDIALGGKGWPRGRIIEVFGPESGGKTTMCLHSITQAQKFGVCALIDAEHAFDPTWARKLGVNCDELLVCQPDNGEQALAVASSLIDVKDVSMVVIDSVAALVPKAELEGEIGDSHVGRQARMMSQAMRMMTGKISNSGCVVIFINQIREKIGVMFGSPETTPGGRALKFFSSCRVDIRRTGMIGEKGDEDAGASKIGHKVRCKVVKNKVAPPFREGCFDLLYDRGIDRNGELIDIALQYKIITRSGAWFKYGDEMIGQGRDNARNRIAESKDLRAEIEAKIFAEIDKI
jgi:recombination protein RecA